MMMMIVFSSRKMLRYSAGPYTVPYLYNRGYLDTQYGLRKDGDSFKIGDSAVLLDPDSNITIKGREIRGRPDCGSY